LYFIRRKGEEGIMFFIKIGTYRFTIDQIVCIRAFPSGCRVYLKTGATMDIVDMDEGDWEAIDKFTIFSEKEKSE
jgi:hypothetical protein